MFLGRNQNEGQLVSQTDAAGTKSFRYDRRGYLRQEVAGSQVTPYRNRCQNGLLCQHTDLCTGQTLFFTYGYALVPEEKVSLVKAQQDLLVNHPDLPIEAAGKVEKGEEPKEPYDPQEEEPRLLEKGGAGHLL